MANKDFQLVLTIKPFAVSPMLPGGAGDIGGLNVVCWTDTHHASQVLLLDEPEVQKNNKNIKLESTG